MYSVRVNLVFIGKIFNFPHFPIYFSTLLLIMVGYFCLLTIKTLLGGLNLSIDLFSLTNGWRLMVFMRTKKLVVNQNVTNIKLVVNQNVRNIKFGPFGSCTSNS